MKKIFYILLANLYLFKNTFAESIKDTLINDTSDGKIIKNSDSDNGVDLLAGTLKNVKDELTSLVSVIVIGVFIFIGFRIFVSRGNPEEFKKALMHFVFAVIGIFIVFIAWGAVKLVSSLTI